MTEELGEKMLTVGQELWYVPADRRYLGGACAVRVLKVGRKWAEVSSNLGRIDAQSLWVDGGKYSSPGRCWLSKEAWEAAEALNSAWSEFYRDMYGRHVPPDHVTVAIIAQVRAILGFSAKHKVEE
jgi:hypothetical protein